MHNSVEVCCECREMSPLCVLRKEFNVGTAVQPAGGVQACLWQPLEPSFTPFSEPLMPEDLILNRAV